MSDFNRVEPATSSTASEMNWVQVSPCGSVSVLGSKRMTVYHRRTIKLGTPGQNYENPERQRAGLMSS